MAQRRLKNVLRLSLAGVVAAAGVATAVVTLPANADTPGTPGIQLTLANAGYEEPVSDPGVAPSAVCPPACPIPRRQWVSMKYTDTWSNESGYKISWRVGMTGPFEVIYQTGARSGSGSVVSFRASDLVGGKTHCFVLEVWNNRAQRRGTGPVCGAAGRPSAPSGAQPVWSSAEAADVEFTRSTTFEAPYKVYVRRQNNSQWSVMPATQWGAQPSATKARYRVTNLLAGTAYCFRVTSAHAFGESAPSAENCRATRPSLTAGWQAFNDPDFTVIKPYDVSADSRWDYDVANTHTTWVYATDKPHYQGSNTSPRTEIRWDGLDYSTGQRMWEAEVYVYAGTDEACIMQILRTDRPEDAPATDFMLHAFDDDGGTLKHSRGSPVIATNVYDRWINVKVAHNATTRVIKVYIDDALAYTTTDNGPVSRRMKNGVYGVGGTVSKAAFRNVTLWHK